MSGNQQRREMAQAAAKKAQQEALAKAKADLEAKREARRQQVLAANEEIARNKELLARLQADATGGKKKKKKSRISKKDKQDIITLLAFFAVIIGLVILVSWFTRSDDVPNQYDGGYDMEEEEEEANYDGIIIVASILLLTVGMSVGFKRIADRRKRKKKEKELEALNARREEMERIEDEAARREVESILAAGKQIKDYRDYHKNYGKGRGDEEPDLPERPRRKTLGELMDEESLDSSERPMKSSYEEEAYDVVREENRIEENERREKRNNVIFYVVVGVVVVLGIAAIAIMLFI